VVPRLVAWFLLPTSMCCANTKHPLISIFVLLQTSDCVVGFLFGGVVGFSPLLIWGCGWIFSPPHLGVWLVSSFGVWQDFFFATIYSAHSLWPNALCRNLVPFAGIEYRLRELLMIMIMI